jgi:hypothetical protein
MPWHETVKYKSEPGYGYSSRRLGGESQRISVCSTSGLIFSATSDCDVTKTHPVHKMVRTALLMDQ